MLKFSQREGIEPDKPLQLQSIDLPLRNGLWNAIHWSLSTPMYIQSYNSDKLLGIIWILFFKRRIDEFDNGLTRLQIKDFILKAEWNNIYDFIEFYCSLIIISEKEIFVKNCNMFLEIERSAYRLLEDKIVPLTDEHELDTIADALSTTEQSGFEGARTHLKTAMQFLSDKENPNYRSSIRESISAIESVCCVITNTPKATLDDAIKVLKKYINIHGALEEAYIKLYGYTSSERGLRHSLLDQDESAFRPEDAKYMLVVCSAFVNYLMAKVVEASIIIK